MLEASFPGTLPFFSGPRQNPELETHTYSNTMPETAVPQDPLPSTSTGPPEPALVSMVSPSCKEFPHYKLVCFPVNHLSSCSEESHGQLRAGRDNPCGLS